MTNVLVFIEPVKLDATPFTTSEVIARETGIAHRKVKNAIRKHYRDVESFGLLASYQAESTGGRPQEIYRLNEAQATFLMTLLKNTPVVVEFKKELVRQFYAMRTDLTRRQVSKAQQLPAHHDLTDAIRDNIPDGPNKKWAYRQFIDLAYINAVGMTARKLRETRGAENNAAAVDYMTSEELKEVGEAKGMIAVLIKAGMTYQEIKALMNRRQMQNGKKADPKSDLMERSCKTDSGSVLGKESALPV